MKKLILLLLAAPLLVWSCSKGYDSYPDYASNAQDDVYGKPVEVVVTVKRAADGTVYFLNGLQQLLYPVAGYPYTEECRAMGLVTIYQDVVAPYGHKTEVHWMEPLDRGDAPSEAQAVSAFEDGIDIITGSWITGIADGYLTLHYKAWWGSPAKHHDICLEFGPDGDMYLIHNANGDGKAEYSDGIIYFDINGVVSSRETPPQTLTLHWLSTDGQAVCTELEFDSRK
ncbi:MAG: hypothetical protein IKZ91_03815 [Bacteroidales bacterium]|nr:hypothetical protein [Bacteroidales bacterium]